MVNTKAVIDYLNRQEAVREGRVLSTMLESGNVVYYTDGKMEFQESASDGELAEAQRYINNYIEE